MSSTQLGQAKRAQNVGAEAWFDMAHARYRRDGRAQMARCHFPVRGAPGKMRPVGKGDTDFVGWARLTGRTQPIAFDLKVDRHASFRINPIEFPELVRQVEFLLDYWRGDGLGFLALLDPSAGELWLLGQRPLEWLLCHPGQYFKFRARHGELWEPEPDVGAGVVCVREADALTLARTGVRYDWLAALPQLLAATP